ncbi:BatD family protein [bacterium]|nr:BatD family protein [bacterium]MBU1994821.1 BatD family protein [bacterium]
MKNLGKIALFLLLIPHAVFAGVSASVNSKSIELGDTVTLSLNISGENIQRPSISFLCDSDITSTGSQTSIQIVNGDYQKSYILSYRFSPQKSCEIAPIEVEVDGSIQKSNPISIVVKPMTAAKDADFVLTLASDKKEVFVGEPFEVNLLFKQRRITDAVDSKFVPPELKGFWIKNESAPQRYEEGEYSITKLVYTMAPQREGRLHITKAQMKIASRDSTKDMWGAWVPQIKWKTYFSNALDIDVKPLPEGVDLVGDFKITASADKNVINVNEAVNVLVSVEGIGNLEDIQTFKPYIAQVNVFDEKIDIQNSKLSQKMAFVAERDFKIPPFSLRYFNPKTKEIKTISTQEINIQVKGTKPQEELTIKRESSAQSEKIQVISEGKISFLWVSLAFVLGLACGILLIIFKVWKIFKREKQSSIKEPKVLLVKLLPYKNDAQVKKIVDILEKNIYSNEKLEIDKKVLKEILKKYEIR